MENVKATTLNEWELERFLEAALDESDDEACRQQFLDKAKVQRQEIIKPDFISPWAHRNMSEEDYKSNQRNMMAYRHMLRDDKKKQVLAIKREYVANRQMDLLYEPLNSFAAKHVIKCLTEEIRERLVKYKMLLTNRLEFLLRGLIPAIVKTTYKRYPGIFIMCQGFNYVASEHYGDFKVFVQPELPDFFDDYMAVINEHLQGNRYTLDKYAEKYHEASAALIRAETKLAYKFANLPHRLALLENNVDHYKLYMESLKDVNN